MRLDTVNQCLDTKALSNLGLWLGIGLGISQVVCDLHVEKRILTRGIPPSVNILSRKSNNEGGGRYCRPTLRYRSSVKPSNLGLGLGLSRPVFDFTP